MNEKLLEEAVSLLQSGDDTGCDGLVVVGATEFLALRKIVHKMTGHYYGSLENDYEDEEESDE